ncbi:MAG: MerR family transcriptional regulator [Lentisphaeria bacterium]|nr:MerR family transcriptional regulator [Lentisphaeria bacterium]
MKSDIQNLYSISDLADQVGVPRTTITDWLGKYARFVEIQTQGRRRFYTERTLSVLCKIAELRTAGRSTGDIDGELERIFPVHPTVEPPDAPDGTEAESELNPGGPEAAKTNAGPQNYPLMKQESFDELYDLLGSKFSDLCDTMGEVNRKADASARRLRLMLAVAVMIIVVLAGFLVLFYVNFMVQRDNTAASRDTATAIAALSAGSETRENALRADVGNLSGSISGLAGSLSGMEGRVSGLTGSLSGMEGRVSGMNDEIQKIRADLPAQRAAFEAAIEEMRRTSGSAMEAQQAQFEARIALEKEQFAAERLKLLQQIESLQGKLDQAAAGEPARDEEIRKLREELAVQTERGKDIDRLNENISVLSGKIEDLRERNRTLSNNLAEANKRADAEAEARKKAEADAENARRAAGSAQNNRDQQSGWNPGMQ